jgi:hypothetical protein
MSLDFIETPASKISLPKSAGIQKLFLDADGRLKVAKFDGSILAIGGSEKQILPTDISIEQLNSVLYPLFEYLTELLNLESEVTDEKIGQATKPIFEFLDQQKNNINNLINEVNVNEVNVQETISNLKVAGEQLKNDISLAKDEVTNKLTEEVSLIETKISDLKVANTSEKEVISSRIEELKKELNKSLAQLKNDIANSIVTFKSLIPEQITVSAGSSNVHVEKNNSDYSISVDIPEVAREVSRVTGGGASKSWVEKYVAANASGGGATTVTSTDGTINVTNVGLNYDLSVDDYIGKTEVASISGDMLNGFSSVMTYDVDGNLSTLTTSSGTKTFNYLDGTLVSISGSGSYASKSFVYDGNGNLININLG